MSMGKMHEPRVSRQVGGESRDSRAKMGQKTGRKARFVRHGRILVRLNYLHQSTRRTESDYLNLVEVDFLINSNPISNLTKILKLHAKFVKCIKID